MYDSAGSLSSAKNNSDMYSQVDKNRKKAKPIEDIYSQVNKPKNRHNSDGPEVKNDVYAQVQKQTQKEKDAGICFTLIFYGSLVDKTTSYF